LCRSNCDIIPTELVARLLRLQILVDMVKGKCALTPMGGVGDALGGYKVSGRGCYVGGSVHLVRRCALAV
jgi:hypothetical protein